MAAKVSYKQGTKATYLGLEERLSTALYWCTDTRELFKGDDLYSDGLRLVASYEALPDFSVAADGILYFCEDNGCGYVLNEARNAWVQVVHGVDDETIGVNESGLLEIKSVPVGKIPDLEAKVAELVQKDVGELTPNVKVATATEAGIIKPGAELEVTEDGTLSVKEIATSKVTGLEARLVALESGAGDPEALDDILEAISWSDM